MFGWLIYFTSSGAAAFPVYLGANQADAAYFGASAVDAIYFGSTQIYP